MRSGGGGWLKPYSETCKGIIAVKLLMGILIQENGSLFCIIKSIDYILRHSCVLAAGIYSTQDGFPIREPGNDGLANENGGNLWVTRKVY